METSISELYDLYRAHPHVSTDTRRIEPDSIFFALRGANFDGNRFAAEALEKGAAAAVIDDPAALADPRMRLVDNTLTALQELAREHRRALGIPILAISGSSGKTTTKELVSRVLSARFTVCATRGNLNNHIGVPLTLLAMDRDTEFGIVEMGASACGEIARLAEIAEPDYGLLTNIGRAHLEGFGGPEGVRRGKGELFDYLAAHRGRAFVLADDETLHAMAAERESLAAEYYPASLADGFESRLEGGYNRFNIAAAVAIGRYFEVPEPEIRRAVADYEPDNHRSQRIETPQHGHRGLLQRQSDSMRAAIENLLGEARRPPPRADSGRHARTGRGRWQSTAPSTGSTGPRAELLLVGGEFARAYAASREAGTGVALPLARGVASPAADGPVGRRWYWSRVRTGSGWKRCSTCCKTFPREVPHVGAGTFFCVFPIIFVFLQSINLFSDDTQRIPATRP